MKERKVVYSNFLTDCGDKSKKGFTVWEDSYIDPSSDRIIDMNIIAQFIETSHGSGLYTRDEDMEIVSYGSESIELSNRLKKLEDFIESDKFKELKCEEATLLVAQKNAMLTYLSILNARFNKIS